VGPELASEDTLHRVQFAQETSARHDAIRREFERDLDFERSFSLNGLFYPDEPRSSSPAPPDRGAHSFSRDELVSIAADSHSYLHLLAEASIWISSVPLDALPVEDREIWLELAESLRASTQRLSGLLPIAAGYPHPTSPVAGSPSAPGPSSMAPSAPELKYPRLRSMMLKLMMMNLMLLQMNPSH
jgi:hypothetical protein